MDDSEREETEFMAKLVGYTTEGAPILQFIQDPGAIKPDRGTVLGRADGGQVIVAFRKAMTVISDNLPSEKVSSGPSTPRTPVVRIAPVPSPMESPV